MGEMTTDNRTSKPNQNETKSGQGFCFTEAQVEAAAEALASREPMRSATEWENLHEFERSGFRESARAALVAAQGVAPVLPSSTESPVGPFKTWFACWWKNEPNAIAESNAQSAFYAGWDARGLPSSGVDEERAEAVRETARYIDRIVPNGLVPKMMILADMEIAADRLGRGIHANGRDREQEGESRG